MDMKEKLVEVFCSALGVEPDFQNAEAMAFVEELIAHGVTVQEWISVKDSLPEGECLAVSMKTGPAYKEMLIGYVGESLSWDTGYECESDGEILPNVTHWMPLPEPPKE